MRSMLPQSRKTTVRSLKSSGGAFSTPLKSIGGTRAAAGTRRAAMNITDVLAELREHLVRGQQRAERVAVGVLVGGEQELVGVPQLLDHLIEVGGYSHPPDSSLSSSSRDPHPVVDRLVVTELERGRVLHVQLAADLGLQEARGGLQPDERLLALVVGAEHAHVHARMAKVWTCVYPGHCHKADPRVLEVVRDMARQDLPHGLVHPPHPRRSHPNLGPPPRTPSRARSTRRPGTATPRSG